MTFFGALYKLLIGPLELFFEIVFVISNRVIHNLGLSIIVLSLVMNFLVLPLYRRADAMQEEARDTENKLKKWASHIKKTFKGDEKFMMLQTYYRQNNYKPTSVLKGSVSLLLEIPFFIAAYNFLSHAGIFEGFSFGPFSDMGKPDGLIKIAGLSVNLLPILMTAINIVSSIIYTKGLQVSSKVQLYGMAGIFLILLYNSPAALVFYWTLNNLFSLVKNLFYKLENPRSILRVLASAFGLFSFILILLKPVKSKKAQVFVICLSLFLQLPIVLQLVHKKIKQTKPVLFTKTDKLIFCLGSCLLTLLTRVLIPSSVISSSPEEFMNAVTYSNPLNYILNSLLIAAGTFIIWFSIFYILMDNKNKKIMGQITWIIVSVTIVNYMFFGKNLSILSPYLVFDKFPFHSIKEYLFNIVIILLCSAGAVVLWKSKPKIINVISSAAIISFVVMSVYNCVHINSVVFDKSLNLQKSEKEKPVHCLSSDGKNVIVIMMDRAISSYIPYIFNEKPEVAEQFKGFTYYPNTISFGPVTNIGAPPLYGGYEYMPIEMNKRDNVLLEDKHNEALKVMPVLFLENNYNVTVFDPPYAGYDWIPDLTIYDNYPAIKKYITMGNKDIGTTREIEANKPAILNRNLFIYSLMKISPLYFQSVIYNKGRYCSLKSYSSQVIKNNYESYGLKSTFMNSYNVLVNLDKITTIKKSKENTFLMMSNNATHEPCMLSVPSYVPENVVCNRGYEMTHKDRFILNGRTMKMEDTEQITHYHANVCAMMQLGNYFDHLRKNNVFDNTKIIIVSDHGRPLHQFDDMLFGKESGEDTMLFNCLLMVKDFGAEEYFVNDQFMTNADVPTLAFKDLIENPVNPFTKKEINSDAKYTQKMNILLSYDWKVDINNGTTFLPGSWYSVHDDIFDKDNWEKIEEK